MPSSRGTKLGTIALGLATAFSAGLYADNAIDSLILKGNIVTDYTQNNAASYISGSSSYLTFRSCGVGPGLTTQGRDGCTVTESGGSTTARTCVIANPFDGTDAPWNGSASVLRFEYQVAANPANVTHDIGFVNSTNSGQNIANSVAIGSGQTFAWYGNNLLSGSLLTNSKSVVNQGGSINVTATTNPTSSYKAYCKAWFIENNAL